MHIIRCTKTTKGLLGSVSKNLSYMPLPNPILLKFPSTPTTGTMIISTFFSIKLESFGSNILYLFRFKGKRYCTILKLLP